MPDRKKLLQDFYAKYAPDQELSDERMKAIDAKYGNDNDALLKDFYAKYAPNEQVTPERLEAISNKYGLKKKESTQSVGTTAGAPLVSPSQSNEVAGSFGDVLQQTKGVQQPTARPKPVKQESAFVKGLRGEDALGKAIEKNENVELLSNTFQNIPTQLEATIPKINLAASVIWKNVLGEELANELLYNPEGRDVNLEAQFAADRLNKLSEQYQETASLVDGIKSGNGGMIAAGVVDAAFGTLVPFVQSVASFGSVTALDMVGNSLKDYNEEKAKKLGISEQELYANNMESVGAPLLVGSMAYGLERVGLKGIEKAMLNKLGANGMKKLALFSFAATQEGATEWVQTGLETFNTEYAKTGNIEDAVSKAADVLTSEQGLESFLKGAVGGGILSGAGNKVVESVNKIQKGELTGKDVAELSIQNAQDGGLTEQLMDAAAGLGEISVEQMQQFTEQKQVIDAAMSKIPAEFMDRATTLAPLIATKGEIDLDIAQREIEKATLDESFHAKIDEDIAFLSQQKEQINAEIQSIITPTKEATTDTEVGATEGVVEGADTAVGEGVQADGVQANEINEIQDGQTTEINPEQSLLEGVRSDRNENQERQESASVRSEKEGEVTNAREQQSGQVREAGVQEQTEGAVDSDMPSVNQAELQDGQETEQQAEVIAPEERQRVINAGGVPAARLLNKDGNLPEARTKMQEYLKTMSKEDTKLLNTAANKQAIKLVNEAETEASMDKAIKYIEKLVGNQQFREAFNNAADALEKAPSKLKRWQGTYGIIDSIKNIKLKGIEDIDLLKEVAEILSKPELPGIQEVDEFVKRLYEYAQKKAEPKGLSTLDSVAKALDTLLESKQRNAEGKMEMMPKEFDTARKVRNLANRVAELEQAVYGLNVDEATQTQLLEQIDKATEVVNKSAAKIKEQMVEDEAFFKKQSKIALFQVVSAKDFLDAEYYNTNIVPIKKNEAKAKKFIDEMNYYQAAKLFRNVENVNNGYMATNFFRDITVPLTNMDKVEAVEKINKVADKRAKDAANSIAQNVSEKFNEAKNYLKGVLGKTIPSDTGLAGKGKLPSIDDANKQLGSIFAAHVDDYFGKAVESPYNIFFKSRVDKALEKMSDTMESIMSAFEKDAGTSLFEGNTGLADLYGRVSGKVFKDTMQVHKIGYYLAQKSVDAGRGTPRNVLKDNLSIIDNMQTKSKVSQADIEIMRALNEQYPDGIKESDLSPSEKRQAEAFKKATEKLAPMQMAANTMRGEQFIPIQEYYPFIPMDMQNSFRDVAMESSGFAEAQEMMTPTGAPVRNPKIRSDRGLSIDPNAEPFVIDPDFRRVLGSATREVVRDRFLFPEVYSATRAFNQVAKQEKSSIPLALKNRYKDMLIASDLSFKDRNLRAIVNASFGIVYPKFLLSLKRFIPEIVGGGAAYYAALPASAKSKSEAMMLASKMSLDGSYRQLVELAKEGVFDSEYESELNKIEEGIKSVKKASKTVMSPDGLHEAVFGRAFFLASTMDKFKELTGKDLATTKMFTNAEYMEQYGKELKEAADFGYAQSRSKYYDKTRTNRPLRPIAAFGKVLDASKGDFNLAFDRFSYMFLGFAHRVGSIFSQRAKDAFTGENYGRAFGAYSFATLASSAAIYKIAMELQSAALVELFGDDEEKKASAARFQNTIMSPEYLSAQYAGAANYFFTSKFGSLGKAATYTALVGLNEAQKAYAKANNISAAEVEQTSRALNNIAKDYTYKYIGREGSAAKETIFSAAGGAGLVTEQLIKFFGDDLLQFSVDAVNGDTEALDFLYLLGMVYNATLSRRTGLPAPFLQQVDKARKEGGKGVDKVVSDYKRGKRDANEVVKELVITAALKSLDNKQRPEEATAEAFDKAYDVLAGAYSREQIADMVVKQMEKMTDPYWLSSIRSKPAIEFGALLGKEYKKTEQQLKNAQESGNKEKEQELLSKIQTIEQAYIGKATGNSEGAALFRSTFNQAIE